MEFVYNFLKIFDLYYLPIEFTYRKNSSFSTCLGGVCSILIIFIFSLYLFFMIYGINSELPILSRIPYSNLIAPDIHLEPYNADYDSLNHSNSDLFLISFGIRNGTSLVSIDQTLLSLQFYYVKRAEGNSFTSSKMNIKYQYIESFYPLPKEEFDFLGLKNTVSPLINATLSGTYGDPGSAYLQVDLVRCSNTTSNITCKSNADINKAINSITFEVFVNQRKYNFSNRFSPVYVDLEQYHYNLIVGFRKCVEFKFSIDIMRSHDSYWPNFIYDYWVDWYILDLFDPEESMRAFMDSDNIISSLYFFPAKEYEVIDRRYKSILEKLYIIGGLEKFFIAMISLFIYFYIKHRFEESMANDFFNIIDPDKEEYILKEFSVYINERYLKLWDINEKRKNSSFLSRNTGDNSLNKFFDKDKLSMILGIESKFELKDFLEEDINNKDKSDVKSILEDSIKNKDCSGIGNNQLMIVDRYNNDFLIEFKNLNLLEYYKNKIIYEIFKYECFDKMFLSFIEIVLNNFCRSFAIKTSKKRFSILDIAKKKLYLEIDFFQLIKSVNELEKIIEIFFDKNQIHFFNCQSTKLITYQSILAEEELENTPFLVRSSFIAGRRSVIKVDKESNKDIMNIIKFEQTLDDIKSRGISTIDRLLIENMGIQPEMISKFDSGDSKLKSSKKQSINNKQLMNHLDKEKEILNKVIDEFRRKSQSIYRDNW